MESESLANVISFIEKYNKKQLLLQVKSGKIKEKIGASIKFAFKHIHTHTNAHMINQACIMRI